MKTPWCQWRLLVDARGSQASSELYDKRLESLCSNNTCEINFNKTFHVIISQFGLFRPFYFHCDYGDKIAFQSCGF